MGRVIVSEDGTLNLWAKRLHEGWQRFERSARSTVEDAIALGRDLIQAKADAGHGQFGRLFSDHPDHVARPMEFTQSWANKLMRMAKNPALANSEHATKLPDDIDAMAMLAGLSEEEIEEAIAEGKITRETTRKEVKALVRDKRPPQASPADKEETSFGDLASVADSQRLHAMADVPSTSDHEEPNTDSIPLAHLKACWRRAGKRDRAKFLRWVEVQK